MTERKLVTLIKQEPLPFLMGDRPEPLQLPLRRPVTSWEHGPSSVVELDNDHVVIRYATGFNEATVLDIYRDEKGAFRVDMGIVEEIGGTRESLDITVAKELNRFYVSKD